MKYRDYQTINTILFILLSAIATGLQPTYGWYAWAIINLIIVLFLTMSYRAAKLEVLANIGMSLWVYERMMQKKTVKKKVR